MSDGIVQLAADSTGKKVDTSEITVGANTVERQRINMADPTTAAAIAAVMNSAPAGTEYGIATRQVGTATIQGLQPAAISTSFTSSVLTTSNINVTQLNVATVSVSGTYTNATLVFEQSTDGGATWYPTAGSRTDTGVIESSSGILSSTVRAWDIPVGGATHLRIRTTTTPTGTAVVVVGTQSFAYDPCPGVVAQGNTAVGSAPMSPPVVVAGIDGGGLIRTVLTTAGGVQVVSLGNSTGKTNVLKTGTLASSATTADQVVLTYTVTTGKTLYLLGFNITARLTTYATTATLFGAASLENPSGTKLNTADVANAGVIFPPYDQQFTEPIPIPSATVIRIVCTPAAATAFTWRANLWGYEI